MNRWLFIGRRAIWLVVFDSLEFVTAVKRKLLPIFSPPISGEILLNEISFQIDLDFDPAMKQMYYGYYQSHITTMLREYLGEGDVFVDVGANVGFLSAFALGLVGKTGTVHAFEPVPKYFERLQNVQCDNPDYNLHVNRVAIGEDEVTTTIALPNLPNIGWNTMVPGFMPDDMLLEEIETRVIRLDNYLSSKNVNNVRLIKIDTEGYEFPVVKGLEMYLRNATHLPVIIMEVAPTAYPKLNTSLDKLSDFMINLRYGAYSLGGNKKINVSHLSATTDVLFLPQDLNSETTR